MSGKIYYANIKSDVESNSPYRKVVYTGNLQLVYMTIQPNDTIHKETHKTHDQFIHIIKGQGVASLNDVNYDLYEGIGLVIPAGVQHLIVNSSNSSTLKLYTIYSPTEHPENLVQEENPDNYKTKYFKYKSKYLKLKNKK
jgi:mannose-6-phosphate isomerase-like protein (cupin superfamily)